MGEMKHVHFHLVEEGDTRYFLAFPGTILADTGDAVEFTATEHAQFFFPEPGIFVEETPSVVAVSPHEPVVRHVRKLNPDGPRELHEYVAFGRDSKALAIGGSNPKIIIGP